MIKVKGVGAVMIYSNHPAELARWYANHLGIEANLNEDDGFYYGDIRDETTGYTVHFGIFRAEKAVKEENHALMINYRVDDLNVFLVQLKARGIVVEKTLDTEYGRFAYIQDPEGNPIELWEPPSATREQIKE